MADLDDRRLEQVALLTAAFVDEIDRHDPSAAIPWETVPDVAAMVDHLGGVHRWAAAVVRTGEDAPDDHPRAAAGGLRAFSAESRGILLDALGTTPADAPCWIIGGRRGVAGFWRRRMVFETVKHLMDLRASGGGRWEAAPELAPVDYADGVDELFEAFLWRSRPRLAALPGAVVLEATDVHRLWCVGADWEVAGEPRDAAARIRATAADLALAAWERADPVRDADRFAITGDVEAVAAFARAPIHPW